nr:ribonuclease H-like domain-containing protein [Tanacetum cinerariifolium]
MIFMRIKKFHKRTRRKLQFDAKEPVGFDKTKVECFNCHKIGHFARDCRSKGNQDSRRRDAGYNGNKARENGRRPANQDDSKPLITICGDDIYWFGHVEEDTQNYVMMAYSSSNSGSDNGVKSCLKACEESYAKHKKLYDDQREKLGDASVEITAYTLALKKVEAQLVCHQQNQLAYEENIRFMRIDLDDKTDVLAYHKKLLAEALKEKDELKTKLENWQNSSQNLGKLLNTQISANDKFRLGYGDHRYGSILSYENEVLQSVFINKTSDLEDRPMNDRFFKADEMHAVPPPMTGNYIPYGPDVEIGYSKFTYGPKQTKADESDAKASEYASYSDDDYVSKVSEEKEKPSFAFTNFVKHVKTPRESVKEKGTTNQSPKVNKNDLNGLMSKRLVLGYAFTRKACFICGSFSHLIRDYDFHEKRMAKQVELNKSKDKGTSQIENRPVWNIIQRVSHKNKFVPSAVLTNTGRLPITTDRQNFSSQATSTNDPYRALKDKGIIDSGCSWHMTGNKAHLADYQDFKGSSVAFGGSNGRITGKGKIKTGKLDFEDVYFVEEVKHYNLFSVSQICDKKNKVLFTVTECLVTSFDFKLPDENQVLLKIPRQHNMYSFNLKNIDPSGYLACLIAKAIIDESNKWHRRLGHVNFKNLNKVVKGNLVRGLPSKIFENDHTCAAFQKGKQHKASCKAKLVSSISQPLQLLHMDLFGPTSPIKSENQANKTTGPKEANHSAEAKNEGKKPKKDIGLKSNENLVDQDFLRSLKGLRDKKRKLIMKLKLLDRISTASPSRVFSVGESSYPDSTIYADQDVSQIPALENIMTIQHCLFACFLSQIEPKKISKALKDESWVDAMQKELMQVKIQKVWILVDLPYGKRAIGTKWVYRNKKDERGVVVRNKARLLALGYRQEERIDYDEVFAFVARIEAIRIFLAFASFMGFIVYQMDGKVPSCMAQLIRRDLKEFDFMSVKTASTLIETKKHLVKDAEAADVDVHIYRYVISSLMYLTTSRPDIMYAVCACSRFQVTPETSHLHVVKRIFSDYAGANLDRKSTTREAEYVAAANCYGQVLWIQNQMLDYGFNFMNTKIYIDNESTIL